jgi:Flp pilus assembly protein TadG
MRRGWGQALVEFAIVAPLLLFILVGGLGLGLALVDRYELQHAVTQGAIAGAAEHNPRRQCDEALRVERAILGRRPAGEACRTAARLLVVSADDPLPLPIPGLSGFRVGATARAEIGQ